MTAGAIVAQDVTLRFGAFVALDAVSLRVPLDGVTALVGPSRAGKSVLLSVLVGLRLPCEGRVTFDGVDLADLGDGRRRFLQERVGFALPCHALPDVTVESGAPAIRHEAPEGWSLVAGDEPTLDAGVGGRPMLDLLDRHHAQGLGILVATHDPRLLARATDVVRLDAGRVAS